MKNIEMTTIFGPCDKGDFIAYVQEISSINTGRNPGGSKGESCRCCKSGI